MKRNNSKQNSSQRKVFISITTTRGADWSLQIRQADELGLKEAAVFLSCLEQDERKKLYQALKKSRIKSIPLVHLRNDMELWELDYFVANFSTKVFNTHSQVEYPLIYDYSKYKNIIYLENICQYFNQEEIKDCAGICLDISHLEDDRLLYKKRFVRDIKILEKYPIGCNHIGAVSKVTRLTEEGLTVYSSHFLENLSELDYLKRYPLKYFSSIIVIELENSIKEQLKARNYIIDLINRKT